MNNTDNLKSYADVENLARFTPQSFEQYCRLKLDSCQQDTEFIIRHIYKGKKLNICEIGGAMENFSTVWKNRGF